MPVGSIIITEDTPTFYGAAISAEDGHVLRYLPELPAHEYGLMLSDGRVVHGDQDAETGDETLRFYTAQMTEYASHAVGTSNYIISGLAIDGSNNTLLYTSSFYSRGMTRCINLTQQMGAYWLVLLISVFALVLRSRLQ